MAIHIREADNTLRSLFGDEWQRLLDIRSLQSMALYLGMPIDVEKLSKDQLMADIGLYLFNNPAHIHQQGNSLVNIAKSPKIYTSAFDFLCKGYGAKLVITKINDFDVFGIRVIEGAFGGGCGRRVLFNYLSDTCGKNISQISTQLNLLRFNLNSMAYFKKKFDWFGVGGVEERAEKLRAAVDFMSKHSVMGFSIMDAEDLEVYFLSTFEDGNRKENSFRKICSLYNNRKTRRNTQKKQCNFSIDEKTIYFIDTLAKDNKMSRSELLERIFRDKNANGFLDMLQ